MNSVAETKRPAWRFGPLAWGVVLALLAVNVAFFSGAFSLGHAEILWIVHSLNPLVWPVEIAWLLWIAVIVKTAHWWFGSESLQKSLLYLILAGLVFVIGFLVREVLRTGPIGVQNGILMKTYHWAVYSPWSAVADRGEWSWKVFIAPALGLAVIAFLISLAIQQRKNRNRHEPDKE